MLAATAAVAGEAKIRDRLCRGLQTEAPIVGTRLRVDCLSPTHAIEIDFSAKWAEAIGQALVYAATADRRPGIILVCRSRSNPALCLRHGLLVEETLSRRNLGVTLWRCDEGAAALDDCRRDELPHQ